MFEEEKEVLLDQRADRTDESLSDPRSQTDSTATDKQTSPQKEKVHIKSLTPTSDQLYSLNLKPGANSIQFVVKSKL